MPTVNLQYKFGFELYIIDGGPIATNSCTIESGTNTEGCLIKYAIFPALPPGLTLGEKQKHQTPKDRRPGDQKNLIDALFCMYACVLNLRVLPTLN